MAAKKTIVVIGATGRQGGSVASTFLGLSNWHVRAITRNLTSEAADTLRTKGAELVEADLANPASLSAAFANAHAIFLNTDYWATYHPAVAALVAENKSVTSASHQAYEYETANGKNAADAAAAVPSLERIIVSSLSSVSKGSGGKYTRALHSEAKAWIVDYIERERPALAAKMSVIYPGAYTTNVLLAPTLDPGTGRYSFSMAMRRDSRMPIINPRESTGPFVRELVEDEEPGVKLLAYDSYLTFGEIVEEWSRASGREAVLLPVTTQMMHEKTGAQYETLDAVDSFVEFGYAPGVDGILEPSQLKTKVVTKSFQDWLRERDWDEVLAA